MPIDFNEGGGRGGRGGLGRVRNSHTPPTPDPITWKEPTPFPAESAAILQRPRIRKKSFPKYQQELVLFLAANLASDTVAALQDGLRKGDKDSVKYMCQILGLLKNDAGVTINLQNNVNIQNTGESRRIDQLVRMLDESDRQPKVIDATPQAVDLSADEEDDDEEAEE